MVFFDLDDTLLDDRSAMVAAVKSIRRFPVAAAMPEADLVVKWFAEAEVMFGRYLNGVPGYERGEARRAAIAHVLWPGIDDGTAVGIADAYTVAYRAAWRPFPDVLPCLAALGAMRVGVITNGEPAQQALKLELMGLAGRFSPVVVSGEAGVAKPDPRIFIEACRRADVAPGDCWMVGDRLDLDAVPAAAAGLRGIWLNRGPDVSGDARVPTIRGLEELPALVGATAPVQ